MLPERFNKQEILLKTRQNLVGLVALQLEKDFSYPDIFNDLEDETKLEPLYIRVFETVSHWIRINPEAVYAVLYRVDLSEIKLRKEMESGLYESFEQAISQLILERVTQKVLMRKGLL